MDDYIIGIDLGTTYSCLAYIDASGTVTVQRNADGKEVTPSAIFFSDGETAVGDTAKSMMLMDPENFVDVFKRDMGTGNNRTINGTEYTPSMLSAIVLKKLIGDFNTDHNCDVKRAVISVPAYFGDAEREATIYAGKIAGLEEVNLIPEPVAASIAYGILDSKSKKMNVLIYDLGGGTFDATVLEINGINYTTLSVDGDKFLGGKDWDNRLIELIMEKVADDPSNNLSLEDLEDDIDVQAQLKMDAEENKKNLTNLPKIRKNLRCGPDNVIYAVTREEFEYATNDLLLKTIEISKNAILHSGLSDKDLDMIVMVGGSSRMPQVRRILEESFPDVEYKLYDPDLSVAKGAAIYSMSKVVNTDVGESDIVDSLKEQYDDVIEETKPLNITTVLSKSYGTGAITTKDNGEEEYKVFNILYRNSQIPAIECQTFYVRYDYQKAVTVDIFENEAYKPQSPDDDAGLYPEDCTQIGQFDITLPRNILRGDPVFVKMEINDDENLFCTVRCGDSEVKETLKYKDIHRTAMDLVNDRKKIQ